MDKTNKSLRQKIEKDTKGVTYHSKKSKGAAKDRTIKLCASLFQSKRRLLLKGQTGEKDTDECRLAIICELVFQMTQQKHH